MSSSGTNRRTRRPLGRRGSLVLEMAAVASTLSVLLLGGLEAGRYFFMQESLTELVGNLARGVVVSPDSDWSTAKAAYVARTQVFDITKFTRLDIAIARAAAPAVTTVTVTAVYPYATNVSAFSGLGTSISSSVSLRFAAP